MSKQTTNKRGLGKFYTVVNPFRLFPFLEWVERIPEKSKEIILEPFAGTNNIIKLLSDVKIFKEDQKWCSFDITLPKENNFPSVSVIKRNTLENYPKNFDFVITNPPYLAKNSAKRIGLNYEYPDYDDLYQKSLDVMLKNSKYIAAIIPESFITTNFNKERLDTFISLEMKMFNDTDHPVCLALFNPEKTKDFNVYKNNIPLGSFKELETKKIDNKMNLPWKFNDKKGDIGLIAIDNTTADSIRFVDGKEISEEKVKCSSRSITRISSDLISDIDLNELIKESNKILRKFREETGDVFLTSFKGLRKDGKYRRRLDFKTAKRILNKAMENIKKETTFE